MSWIVMQSRLQQDLREEIHRKKRVSQADVSEASTVNTDTSYMCHKQRLLSQLEA